MAKLKDRYADELMEISEESGALAKDLEQALLIREIIESDDVQTFILNPQVSDSAKRQLFNKAFSGQLNWHLMSFLHNMIQDNRESLILPVLSEFVDRINRRSGKIEARVVAAKELSKQQIEAIRNVLSKKINMEVEVKASVDQKLIGGFYVLVDDHIFDGTVKSELNLMKERLKRGNMNDS